MDRMPSLAPRDPEEFDPSVSPPELAGEPARARRRRRGGKIVRVVSGFLLGQGTVQAVNLLAGLFLVHRLSVERYAQFGIATGFQGVFSILMDLGFASTIIPLVGSRGDDPALIGRYVRAARHLRDRTFWILAPVASVAFLATIHKRNWSWELQAGLLASILLSLYSAGVVSFFSAPLFLLGRLREYYLPQVYAGAARLVALVAIAYAGGLTAWTAAGLGALNITLTGVLIRRAGMRHITWPARDSPETDGELLKFVLPSIPASVFSAFQSQIALFMISFFGGTVYVAEVSALSRIGALFAVLATFNTIVIEPYIARLERRRLLANFAGMMALASAACVPLVLLAFLRPGFFIAIIGAKYEGVREPMGWYILSSCISFVAGLLWIMNRARKWVFWSGSAVEIVLLLCVQFGYLALVGVRTTRQAVLFSLTSAVAVLIAHLYVTVRGFMLKRTQTGL